MEEKLKKDDVITEKNCTGKEDEGRLPLFLSRTKLKKNTKNSSQIE